MRHARQDYDKIQDLTHAVQLAELVLDMNFASERGNYAKYLARRVLGVPTATDQLEHAKKAEVPLIPGDEPVFLIRGQDAVSGDAVRAWADLAERAGSSSEIIEMARAHAAKMDEWPKKKTPDLPVR